MAEIDPVILQLRADTNAYLGELRRTTRTAEQQLGLQERRVKALETQMARSSGAIGVSLRGIAGVLAASFTGRELVGFIDSFTRLQNELKIAGLEGENLAGVQTRLFDIANKNGVAINALADLYGKSAQAGRELGASQEQLLAATEATALALRISGTDATQASGAILGLTQALAAGVVRAEEFNQINEGGLRPLLQAAANTERFGGSVAKLRAEVLDGTVSSKELFVAILQGTDQLRNQAASATLTLSGAFETLQNKLIEYVGGTASASGATGALAEAIGLLADNIETVIEALAVIGVALGTRYVVGAVAASGATRALVAYLGVATTSLAGTALAARSAGAALLGAVGGPVGLAVGALTVGLGYLAVKNSEVSREAERLRSIAEQNAAEFGNLGTRVGEAAGETSKLNAQQVATKATAAGLAVDTKRLADAHYQAALAARTQRVEEQKLAVAQSGKDYLAVFRRETTAARVPGDAVARGQAGMAGILSGQLIQGTPTGDARNQAAAERIISSPEYQRFKRDQAVLQAILNEPITTGTNMPPPLPGNGKKGPKAKKDTGPTQEELLARFNQEMSSLQMEELSARERMASGADERADIQLEMLRLERDTRMAQVEASELLPQQKKALIEQIEAIYGTKDAVDAQGEIIVTANNSLLAQQVLFEQRRQIEQEARDLAEEQYRAKDDELRLQYEMADTLDERRRIALEALELEDRHRAALLQTVIASETASEVDKQRARIAQQALDATSGMRRGMVARANAGALERYGESLGDPKARVEEAVARRLQDVNDGITDAITDTMGIEDPLIAELLGILIDDILIRPIIDTLRNAKSGSSVGDILGGILSVATTAFGGGSASGAGGGAKSTVNKIKARASGGPVNAGQPYLVGERGPELMIPNMSGAIINANQTAAMMSGGSGGGGNATVRLELAGDLDARIQSVSAGVAVEVVRIARPAIVADAANETFRRASRPSL